MYNRVFPILTPFKHKLIAMDLSKQQALDPDSKVIQEINFTPTLDRAESTARFFIIKEAKKTILDFSQRTAKVFWVYSIILLVI